MQKENLTALTSGSRINKSAVIKNSFCSKVLTFPALSNDHNWRLYSRLQGLYIHDLKHGDHSRNQYFVRQRVSYKQFAIKASANWDYYEATKKEKRKTTATTV
ncbi:hypothetical protein [Niabella sp.]|uniref:hypothetical protein n=1 Tax=Niabella sp. TaxID=1962976 RepID=UPI0026247D07|nr:hypothetical protein [Niabella sp.]